MADENSQTEYSQFDKMYQSGQSLYYGTNTLSNNMIMADRKMLANE